MTEGSEPELVEWVPQEDEIERPPRPIPMSYDEAPVPPRSGAVRATESWDAGPAVPVDPYRGPQFDTFHPAEQHESTVARPNGRVVGPGPGQTDPERTDPALRVPPGREAEAIRLGIWGAVQSGKSTFLHVLPSAVDQYSPRGDWTLTSLNSFSTQYLTTAKALLHGERRLPQGTRPGDRFVIDWRLEEIPRRELFRPWRRRPARRIDLHMTDQAGSEFENPTDELVAELGQAHGIVYLFDVEREYRDGDAYQFFGATMDRLREHMRDRLLPGGKLPHHLAVCVTKLDEARVFALARRGHWVTPERRAPFRPRVADRDAHGFFDWLCDHPRAGSAATVRDQIRANFDRRRVRYHVSSAVGFRVDAGREVDLDDYDNLDMRGGVLRLRGAPRPINVVEPLLGIEAAVRRGRS